MVKKKILQIFLKSWCIFVTEKANITIICFNSQQLLYLVKTTIKVDRYDLFLFVAVYFRFQ